jgi:hypothetical protein
MNSQRRDEPSFLSDTGSWDSWANRTEPPKASDGAAERSGPEELAVFLRSLQPCRADDQASLRRALTIDQLVTTPIAVVRKNLIPFDDGGTSQMVTDQPQGKKFVLIGNVSLGITPHSSAYVAVVITPSHGTHVQLMPTSILARHGLWAGSCLSVSGYSTDSVMAQRPSVQDTAGLRVLVAAGVFRETFVRA